LRWNDYPGAVAVQPDGKILAVGSVAWLAEVWYQYRDPNPFFNHRPQWVVIHPPPDAVVIRYNADGTLDTSFGDQGLAMPGRGSNTYASSLALQADGKIVTGETTNGYDFTLARYTPYGALDGTFGTGGRVTTGFSDSAGLGGVVVQPDGKI